MSSNARNSDRSIYSTEDVWEKFVSGDTAYFEKLFKKYYRQMYGYGMKLCNRSELIEDCIQDLFKHLWEIRDELSHIHSPNVYLFVSLRRKIFKSLEKSRKFRGKEKEIPESPPIAFGMQDLILKKEVQAEQKKVLLEALNQLPHRQKEVLYLHFYNGMSYGEIEQILSINRQSVRNHMYRAMQTLRTLLDKEVMKLVITLMVSFLLPLSFYL